jgi:FMS-like tyrosine kinase 1
LFLFSPRQQQDDEHDEKLASQQASEITQTSEIKFSATQAGSVRCKAKNRLGSDNASGQVKVGDLSRPFMVMGLEDDQKIAEGDSVRLECGAIIYNYTSSIVWRKDGDVIEEQTEENNTKFSWRKSITWRSISKQDSGIYECEVTPKDPEAQTETIQIPVSVMDTQKPLIISNFNQSVITHAVGDSFTLDCLVTGLPVPSLKWYKDDQNFVIDESNAERISFETGNTSIYFKVLISEDAGTYKCVAFSRVGEDVRSVQLEIPSESKPNFIRINQ